MEGFDFDQTYGALTSFVETGQSAITLVVKRLVKRQPMTVGFQFSPSDEEAEKGLKPWTKEVGRGVWGVWAGWCVLDAWNGIECGGGCL